MALETAEATMIDRAAIESALTAICERHEHSAPTVHAWADGLYIRLGDNTDDVRLSEVAAVAFILADGGMTPHYAANYVYHPMYRLGQDVTGHLGC